MVLHYSERGYHLMKKKLEAWAFLPLYDYVWFQVCVKRDEGWNSVEFQFEILWCWSPWQRNKGRLLLIIIAWTQQALLSWQVEGKPFSKSRIFLSKICALYLFRELRPLVFDRFSFTKNFTILLLVLRMWIENIRTFSYFPISTNFTIKTGGTR